VRFFTKYKVAILFLVLLTSHFSSAQVINDHIDKRIELKVNAPAFSSNTTNCTVDWSCVDESLTGKCIEYHNDQWFWFKTNQAGKYFININGQKCRDTRGVQLVVIDGVPCQPKTYKILSCTSLASQDDIYVELEALQANHAYLLNIDGYLNDFCSFQIQVSTQPVGMPVQPVKEEVIASSKIEADVVQLNWTITEELSSRINDFVILRRKEGESKFMQVKAIAHEKNTFGKGQLSYTAADKVEAYGTYFYKIIASAPDGNKMLLSVPTIGFSALDNPDLGKTEPSDYITLDLDFKTGTPVSIYVYDAISKKVLMKAAFDLKRKDRKRKYYVGHLKSQGVQSLEIKVTDQKRKVSHTKLHQF
jgi:hypothetical protein